MTCIAFDGRMLAADKRASNSGMARTVTKIKRLPHAPGRNGPCLLAMTGAWDVAVELREWFENGAHPSSFPASARKDEASLIVISAVGVESYAAGPYPMPIEEKQCAFGSGRDFATAAMHLGRSAKEAVEIACLFQTDCGNGVDVLTLE